MAIKNSGTKVDEIYMDVLASEFEGKIPNLVEQKVDQTRE